ncbi:MAG: hypothetical protein HY291_18855 [Planctomycetes bacterium]|nr:hypothetical protein [Planctomycetota bacterium]
MNRLRLYVPVLAFLLIPWLRAEDAKPEVKYACLSAEEAKAAIVNDKSDPYFERMQTLEMSCKTGAKITGGTLEEQRAEARKRYQAGVQDFTPEEKKMLAWAVERLQPILARDYPLYARTPWSFIKLSDRIEGGLPHTRGAHIVIGSTVLKQLAQLVPADAKDDPMALAQIADLLLHKQTHVIQRAHPERFAKLYKEVWKFEYAKKIVGCAWLTERSLANPDGTDVSWVFPVKLKDETHWVWPLVVLGRAEDDVSMPADLAEVCVRLDKTEDGYSVHMEKEDDKNARDDKKNSPDMKELSEVAAYVKEFPVREELFHPNEICAVMFSKMVLADALIPKDKIPKEALERFEKNFAAFKAWAKENLK